MKKKDVIIILVIIFIIASFFSSEHRSLGKGYSYFNEGCNGSAAIHSNGYDDIPPVVLDLKYNKKFIIVKQKPGLGDIMYKKVTYPYGDSVYYWIIIKKEHRLIGPLNKEEFKRNKEKYNIKLKLSE